MGIKERRAREKEQQRQKILDAALQIITLEGFSALSMRKLAERIEYSPASIYLYFESREQIAQELSEVGFGELLQTLLAAATGKAAAAALDAVAAAYVAYGVSHPEIYRLIFMGDSDYMAAAFGKQNKDSAANRAYRVMLEVAGQLQKAGFMQQLSPVTITDMIWSTVHGIVTLHITCASFMRSTPEDLVKLATGSIANTLPKRKRRSSPPAAP